MPTDVDVEKLKREWKRPAGRELKPPMGMFERFARAALWMSLGAGITVAGFSKIDGMNSRDIQDLLDETNKALADLRATSDEVKAGSVLIDAKLKSLQREVNDRVDAEFSRAAGMELCNPHEDIPMSVTRYYNPEYKVRLIEAAGERGCFSLKLTP